MFTSLLGVLYYKLNGGQLLHEVSYVTECQPVCDEDYQRRTRRESTESQL